MRSGVADFLRMIRKHRQNRASGAALTGLFRSVRVPVETVPCRAPRAMGCGRPERENTWGAVGGPAFALWKSERPYPSGHTPMVW